MTDTTEPLEHAQSGAYITRSIEYPDCLVIPAKHHIPNLPGAGESLTDQLSLHDSIIDRIIRLPENAQFAVVGPAQYGMEPEFFQTLEEAQTHTLARAHAGCENLHIINRRGETQRINIFADIDNAAGADISLPNEKYTHPTVIKAALWRCLYANKDNNEKKLNPREEHASAPQNHRSAYYLSEIITQLGQAPINLSGGNNTLRQVKAEFEKIYHCSLGPTFADVQSGFGVGERVRAHYHNATHTDIQKQLSAIIAKHHSFEGANSDSKKETGQSISAHFPLVLWPLLVEGKCQANEITEKDEVIDIKKYLMPLLSDWRRAGEGAEVKAETLYKKIAQANKNRKTTLSYQEAVDAAREQYYIKVNIDGHGYSVGEQHWGAPYHLIDDDSAFLPKRALFDTAEQAEKTIARMKETAKSNEVMDNTTGDGAQYSVSPATQQNVDVKYPATVEISVDEQAAILHWENNNELNTSYTYDKQYDAAKMQLRNAHALTKDKITDICNAGVMDDSLRAMALALSAQGKWETDPVAVTVLLKPPKKTEQAPPPKARAAADSQISM